MDSEVIEYLSDGLKRGTELEEIRQQLLFRGYADYDISEAIKELVPDKEEKKESEEKEGPKDESIEGWDEILE